MELAPLLHEAGNPELIHQIVIELYEFKLFILALAVDEGFQAHLIFLVESGVDRCFIVSRLCDETYAVLKAVDYADIIGESYTWWIMS